MTADKLAMRFEMGLEHDPRYKGALAAFCALVLRSGVRVPTLRAFLSAELPDNEPDSAPVLFLEATARLLGQKWVDGDCSFVDVSIGSARLQELIRVLSMEFRSQKPRGRLPLVAILTPNGEQHTLGQHILGLLFDAAGWSNITLEGKNLASPHLREAIRQADVVCIGWSNQRLKKEFSALVGTIRSIGSANRPPVIAGGVAALDSIDFLVSLGIDCICDSVYSAFRICERFYELESAGQKPALSARKYRATAGEADWLAG